MANSYFNKTRPEKPYPEFPLFAHNSGQWCRKIRGKIHSFGPWDDPTAALKKHNEQFAFLKEGILPPEKFDGWILGDLVNEWLGVMEDRLNDGEIRQPTFDACHRVGELIVKHMDRRRAVESLQPNDFRKFRSELMRKYELLTVKPVMTRVRQMFKFAYDERLIDRPVFYGQGFKLPTKSAIRKDRSTKPKKLFTADQVRLLVGHASPPLKAIILLGINAGLNCADVGGLKPSHIVDGWLDYPRQKTGVERRAKLWPETIQAIDGYLKVRQTPFEQFEDLVFVTKGRNSWSHTAIGHEFRKLVDAINAASQVDEHGQPLKTPPDEPFPHGSFTYLRHTFQTRGEDTGDSIAVKMIMGHVDDSISADYREEVINDRLEAVADHVHGWLFGKRGAK